LGSIVTIENLWYTYPNGVTALKNVNLSIEEGPVLTIIGQNGSGKTTLVKMLNGLLKPTRGKVTVAGIDTANKKTYELAKYVGYAFQNPIRQLYEDTVEKELMAGPINLGFDEAEARRRAEMAIELFKLEGIRTLRPSSISFPLKKLVGVASVFTMEPKVMVLDEPTTGQDHLGISMIQNAIKTIKDMGITLVIITHDMRFVLESADNVVVMANAEVIREGTPLEIFVDKKTMEVASLSPPQIVQIGVRLQELYPAHGGPSRTVDEEVITIKRMVKKTN